MKKELIEKYFDFLDDVEKAKLLDTPAAEVGKRMWWIIEWRGTTQRIKKNRNMVGQWQCCYNTMVQGATFASVTDRFGFNYSRIKLWQKDFQTLIRCNSSFQWMFAAGKDEFVEPFFNSAAMFNDNKFNEIHNENPDKLPITISGVAEMDDIDLLHLGFTMSDILWLRRVIKRVTDEFGDTEGAWAFPLKA